MARAFDGTDDYLQSTAPAVTTYPLTYSFWVNLPSTASNAFLMMLVTSSVGEFGNFAVRYHTASNRILFRVDSTAEGGSFDAVAPDAISANTWYHVLARAFSNTDRRIRINGGTDGTNTTLCNPALIDWLVMGAHSEEGSIGPFSAIRLAEVGIYNVALSDEDGAALAKGLSPEGVRPESLVHYYPLIGRASPESDLFGGAGLTVTGATAYDHPRVIYPSSRRLVAVPDTGVSGAGAASGAGTATGAGAVARAAVGTATATGAAAGVPVVPGDGAAAGVGAANGVGAVAREAVGSATGSSDAAAVGQIGGFTSGAGDADGVGVASGVGAVSRVAVGTAAGVGAASSILTDGGLSATPEFVPIAAIPNTDLLRKRLNEILGTLWEMMPSYGPSLPAIADVPDGRIFVRTTDNTTHQLQYGAWRQLA